MADGFESNATEVAVQLTGYGLHAALRLRRVVTHHAMLLEARIKANASGRPGPNAPTGDYRGSWTTEVTDSGDVVEARVGTNKPQARRLEYGFFGMTDRIGRTFYQPAYPHVAPAVAAQEPLMRADMSRALSG